MSALETTLEAEHTVATDLLPEHPLFEGLSDRHREILAGCSMLANFRAGEKIVETGEHADCFYLILSGSVSLETPGGRTRQSSKIIARGDILGWSWLFPPDFWHFDATALQATEVIYFYSSQLRLECDRDHGLGYELFKRLAQCRKTASTITTTESTGTASDWQGTESANTSAHPLMGRKRTVFALTVESADDAQGDGTSLSTWWPKILFDNARAAIRSAASASGGKTVPALPRA